MPRWSRREAAGLRRGPRTAPGRTHPRAVARAPRAQTEPLAALVALFAVCAGVSLYATVLGGSFPVADRDLSDPTLERVRDAASSAGVVRPGTLPTAVDAGPDGWRVNATLTTRAADDRRRSEGPPAPDRADTASRVVSVRLGPGRIVPGRLTVRVWR